MAAHLVTVSSSCSARGRRLAGGWRRPRRAAQYRASARCSDMWARGSDSPGDSTWVLSFEIVTIGFFNFDIDNQTGKVPSSIFSE